MTTLADVHDRRIELGITKSEAARLASVARGTWYDVENGVRFNLQPKTLHGIEVAMEWPPGTLTPKRERYGKESSPNSDLTEILYRLDAIEIRLDDIETDIHLLKKALR